MPIARTLPGARSVPPMASSLTLKRLLSKPLASPLRSVATTATSRLFSADAATPDQNHDRPLSRKDEVHKAPVVVLFHASGLTSNQWRKLKNLWYPGKTLFRPIGGTEKGNKFFEQVDRSAGPTSVLYLPEGAVAEKMGLLPSEESAGQDMLLLYGQYESSLVDHVDISRVSEFDGNESSLFGFYLPGSYLCSVLDPVFAAEEESVAGPAEATQA